MYVNGVRAYPNREKHLRPKDVNAQATQTGTFSVPGLLG